MLFNWFILSAHCVVTLLCLFCEWYWLCTQMFI